jgi:hypothetical protein
VDGVSTHREHMMAALKQTFLPVLRQKGFVGSFPHFQRRLDNRIDFLNVQFARVGGRFCLNIGQTGPKGLQDPAWPELALTETTVGHLLHHRSRVHWGFFMKQWFDFGPRSYDPPKDVKPPSYYEAIAVRAVKAFEKDGERWFNKSRALS